MATNWNPIRAISPAEWLDGPAEQQRTELNARIEQLQEARELLAHRIELARNQDPLAFDPATVVFDDFRRERLELEQAEYQVRDDLANFLNGPWTACLSAAVDAASTAVREAEAEVRRRLVQVGFVDSPPTSGAPGRIMPIFVLSHPLVIDAKARYTSLHNLATSGAAIRENRDAMAQLEARFAAEKAKSLQRAGL